MSYHISSQALRRELLEGSQPDMTPANPIYGAIGEHRERSRDLFNRGTRISSWLVDGSESRSSSQRANYSGSDVDRTTPGTTPSPTRQTQDAPATVIAGNPTGTNENTQQRYQQVSVGEAPTNRPANPVIAPSIPQQAGASTVPIVSTRTSNRVQWTRYLQRQDLQSHLEDFRMAEAAERERAERERWEQAAQFRAHWMALSLNDLKKAQKDWAGRRDVDGPGQQEARMMAAKLQEFVEEKIFVEKNRYRI